VKRTLGVALGILTAIGGSSTSATWSPTRSSDPGSACRWGGVVTVGVTGICLFAQMSGKVAAVSGRATVEIIRERLGPGLALDNLAASFLINLMTVTAERGGWCHTITYLCGTRARTGRRCRRRG
jgi:manganese transport protein